MSEIQTSVGATVKKGDIIGLTGTTGLAGGDHLHFGILMHGIQVQPLDWLDPKWIKNTITDRLDAARGRTLKRISLESVVWGRRIFL